MTKSNRLTFWIFIALLTGIAFGTWLNATFPAPPVKSYEQSITSLRDTLEARNDRPSLAVALLSTVSDSTLNDTLKWQTALLQIKQDKKGGSIQAVAEKALAREEMAHPVLKNILEYLAILTDIFLRLIKMIIAPLVFSTLVVGVAKLGDLKAVGRIGGKTMLWFISASFVSLLLGCLLVNFFEPGRMMQLDLPPSFADSGVDKAGVSLREFITHIIPSSVAEAMAKNEILQIVIFSLLFGVATAAVGEKGEPIIRAMDAIGHVMLKITSMVMYVAPFAVFAAMTSVVAKKGLGVLSTYAVFIGEFYFGLFILWTVLFLAGYFLVKKRITTLFKRLREALLLAFSTASSEAAFPKMMEELERFGCRNRIVSFTLPLGYSFNLDGSMMYMTFASIFIAQSYNIHMDFGTQLTMLLTLMITSKGIAGVPRASLVVIAGTLAQFNIPEAGILLLLGVDHVLDMGRSATNVVGNAIATVAVSKWEKSLDG